MAQRGTTAHIDLVELEKLCSLQCTDEEIAAWFKVTTRTIERRRKVQAFRDVMERGKAKGRISVRRMQMKMLEEGNATMGVWLGKQLLGQTDQLQYQVNAPQNIILCLPRPSADLLEAATRNALERRRLLEAPADTEQSESGDCS
jgi:hypothetical protein